MAWHAEVPLYAGGEGTAQSGLLFLHASLPTIGGAGSMLAPHIDTAPPHYRLKAIV